RIHGELLRLGFDVSERTVSRLIPKRRPLPSQTWRTFLANHVCDLVSLDFFTVPTARLRVLFVLFVLALHARAAVRFTVPQPASRPAQACPRHQAHRPPRGGQDPAGSRSRRSTPSLRPPGSVVHHRRLHYHRTRATGPVPPTRSPSPIVNPA